MSKNILFSLEFQKLFWTSLAIPAHFCSMKITQDVREFAAKESGTEEKALAVVMAEKAKEFVDK